MKVNVFFVFLFLQAYYEKARAYQQGVNRMDDEAKYVKHQDIVKAIKLSKPAWFYGYSDNSASPRADFIESLVNEHEKCMYFTKESLTNTNVNFTKHVFESEDGKDGEASDGNGDEAPKEGKKDKYGKEKQIQLYGIFFNTSIVNNGAPDVRNASNAIIVTNKPDEQKGKRFKLLYSDNSDCSILRPMGEGGIPPPGEDQSYWTNTPTRCILLLSEAAARGPAAPIKWDFARNHKLKHAPKGMPQYCQWVFMSLCGQGTELKVVFKPDCPSIPNPLGC